jgi:hypothetical protein
MKGEIIQSRLEAKKHHEEKIVWLAEEEAAFNTVSQAAARAITLKKEYQRMNEDLIRAVPPSDFMAMVTGATRDPAIEPLKLQQLLEMAERMMKFDAERAFNDAMRACQEEIAPIARTAENSHTGTSYTRLEDIDREIRPIYTRHGFVMSFGSGGAKDQHSVRVTCDVRHSGGHTVRYELEGELDTAGLKGGANKTGIQGLGSTITHLRRYLTQMIWNLTLADPVKSVTAEQAENIRNALDQIGIIGDRYRQFLKFAQAESVGNIAAGRYNEVMKMLKRAQLRNGADKITPRAESIRPIGDGDPHA